MKKTPKNWKSLTVIDACAKGYHLAHYGRQQEYLEHISAQEIVERTLRANPARIHIQLMPETLVFLQPLSTPQFKDRIGVYGRFIGPEDAPKIHPSCGGLRPLGRHDTIIAAAWNQLLDELSESVLATTLSRHPAWAYLTFPFGHSVRDVTTLLVSVIDPRLHVRPDRPDAISPLRNFLGATRRQSKRSKAKLETLCRAWGKGRVDRKDFGRPDAFFSRHYWKLRDGGESEDEADMKTGFRYVAYLQKTWLEAMRTTGKESIFDPQILFDTPDVFKALKSRVQELDALVIRG